MARIILEVDEQTKAFVKRYAEKNQWTMSTVLRGVIDDWKSSLGKKRKGANAARSRGKRATKN